MKSLRNRKVLIPAGQEQGLALHREKGTFFAATGEEVANMDADARDLVRACLSYCFYSLNEL